jgi:hypothetical protein
VAVNPDAKRGYNLGRCDVEPNMGEEIYTVVPGINTVTLQLAVNRYTLSLGNKFFRERNLVVFNIERLSEDENDPGSPTESEDFRFLHSIWKTVRRFRASKRWAEEACGTVGFAINRLGTIDLNKLRSLPRPFRMTFRSEV